MALVVFLLRRRVPAPLAGPTIPASSPRGRPSSIGGRPGRSIPAALLRDPRPAVAPEGRRVPIEAARLGLAFPRGHEVTGGRLVEPRMLVHESPERGRAPRFV